MSLYNVAIYFLSLFGIHDYMEPPLLGPEVRHSVNQYEPYMVSLKIHYPEKDTICTGSLISKNFVLTAASCIDKNNVLTITAILGAHKLTNIEPSQQGIPVSLIIVPIDTESATSGKDNNIALLRLERPVATSLDISPISLPSVDDQFRDYAKENAKVFTWYKNGKYETLQEICEIINDEKSCENLQFNNKWRPTKLCGNSVNKNCSVQQCSELQKEDNGVPLIFDNNGNKELIGIYCFSSKISHSRDAFTSINDNMYWIQEYSDVVISRRAQSEKFDIIAVPYRSEGLELTSDGPNSSEKALEPTSNEQNSSDERKKLLIRKILF